MRTLALAIGMVLAFAATASTAADTKDKPQSSQQTRMAACNKEAGARKGDERKSFMKTCLSEKRAAEQDKKARKPRAS